MRQHLRIQPIGLRQAPARTGKVAYLAGMDHRDGQAGNAPFGDEWCLIASRRLKHHQPWAEPLQPPHDCGDARRIIGQLPFFAGGVHRHVQRGFGHSDPDDQSLWLTPTCSLLLPDPSRQPGLAGYGLSAQLALATVRAHRGEGRDDPCSSTASRDRGMNGLSRPPAAGTAPILHDS